MDFIERWLGVSPDGGAGIYGALLITGVLVGLGMTLYIWRH